MGVSLGTAGASLALQSSNTISTSVNATKLFTLSQQALLAFEQSNHYDLDYLIAMILQLLFLLHDGKPRIAAVDRLRELSTAASGEEESQSGADLARMCECFGQHPSRFC